MLLNVAVGGQWPGGLFDDHLSATMKVDWVRVYERPTAVKARWRVVLGSLTGDLFPLRLLRSRPSFSGVAEAGIDVANAQGRGCNYVPSLPEKRSSLPEYVVASSCLLFPPADVAVFAFAEKNRRTRPCRLEQVSRSPRVRLQVLDNRHHCMKRAVRGSLRSCKPSRSRAGL